MKHSEPLQVAADQLREAAQAHSDLQGDTSVLQQLVAWSERCAEGLRKGGVVFFAGNGGSFADAQHMSAELTGKMGRMRIPLAGIALGTNSSSMSAIGNDFGFPQIFARELDALKRPESLVIALTTSGNSENMCALVDQAQRLEMPVIAFTGEKGGAISRLCETIKVPSNRTERIQEMHILLGHTMCLLIENFLQLGD